MDEATLAKKAFERGIISQLFKDYHECAIHYYNDQVDILMIKSTESMHLNSNQNMGYAIQLCHKFWLCLTTMDMACS